LFFFFFFFFFWGGGGGGDFSLYIPRTYLKNDLQKPVTTGQTIPHKYITFNT